MKKYIIMSALLLATTFGMHGANNHESTEMVVINGNEYQLITQYYSNPLIILQVRTTVRTHFGDYVGESNCSITRENPTVARLGFLKVDKKFRRYGIGTYLFRRAVAHCAQYQKEKLIWEALPFNLEKHEQLYAMEKLVRWYQGLGARIVGTINLKMLNKGINMEYVMPRKPSLQEKIRNQIIQQNQRIVSALT